MSCIQSYNLIGKAVGHRRYLISFFPSTMMFTNGRHDPLSIILNPASSILHPASSISHLASSIEYFVSYLDDGIGDARHIPNDML